MQSILLRASRPCRDVSTRSAQFVSVVRRSFLTSFAKNPAPCAIRQQSSLATALRSQPDTPFQDSDEPDEQAKLPNFSTIEGSISHPIYKALTQKPMSLTRMSPVQAAVFPLLPKLAEPYDPKAPEDDPARDILVKAKTGTGKTLAFLVPAVEARLKAVEEHAQKVCLDAGRASDDGLARRARMAYRSEHVGALIISPTRELATQIVHEAQRLTAHLDDFGVRLFVGGASKGPQMRDWMRGKRDILVATPGRLRDFIQTEPEVSRGLAKTPIFILDEADTLLDMGFRPDVDDIATYLPPVPQRQTFLFSATVSPQIQDIAKQMLAPNHRFINCVHKDDSPVHAHVPQYHTVLRSASQQIPHVLQLLAHDQLNNPGSSKVLIFLPTTKMTQLFSTVLSELAATSLPAGKNMRVYEIHSKRTMQSRTRASDSFRFDNSGASVLVSSDISARGVDYPNVTRVIQVGCPAGTEQYIHRVGRTGRAGTAGRGDLVLLPWEINFPQIRLTQVPIKPLKHQDLVDQTMELAKKFDEDPKAFFENGPKPPTPRSAPSNSRRRSQPTSLGASLFKTPLVTALEGIDKNAAEIVSQFDETAIKETFFSLMGYYITRQPDLSINKSAIVEGCKEWSTAACGLEAPPFISERWLEKLGYGRLDRDVHRKNTFGSQSRPRQSSWESTPRRQNSWESRPRRQNSWDSQSSRKDSWDGLADAAVSGLKKFGQERRGYQDRERGDFSFGDRQEGYGLKGRGSGGGGGGGDKPHWMKRGSGGGSEGGEKPHWMRRGSGSGSEGGDKPHWMKRGSGSGSEYRSRR